MIGNPVLRKKARAVHKVTSELVEFADSMEALMRPTGVGLAAPQVGRSEAFFIYDVGDGLRLIVNPQILERKGAASDEEGCLSVPDFTGNVERRSALGVRYLTIDGGEAELETSGFEAVVLQHEIDHLDGVLFLDRIANVKRDLFKRKTY